MSRARSVAEFIRDTRVSQRAQHDYRENSNRLSEIADMLAVVGDGKRAGQARLYAFIARNAARAEYFDPDPRA